MTADLTPVLQVWVWSFVLGSGVGVARQEDEALERLLTRTLRSRTANGDVCPSAEDVAAYLERSLDGEEMRRVELHLSSCARCAETLALLVESEPAAASALPPAAWWSWNAWRWAVPAAAVLVIGVWFASTLRDGSEPASQMAQYNQDETAKKEAADLAAQSAPEAATQSATQESTEAQSRRSADAAAAGAQTVPAESARANQASADQRREAEKASDRVQPLDRTARAASEADSAAARPSTAAQPSPEQPRALAKAEESRSDAALSDAVKENANAGFAPPAPPAATAAAAPAAAPPTAAAAPPAAPAGGGAARAAAGATPPPRSQRQEAAEAAPQRARTVAGFAPLVLRTRSGNALWRVAGSVIERSTDGGTTWATEFRAPGTINTGVIAADDTVWLVGANGLVLRRPAAGGWRVVSPPSMDDLIGVSEPGSTSVTVRTAAGRQFRTTDNGATWMAR